MQAKFYSHLSHLIGENVHSKQFLLAVSGGKDSTVLAHLFYSCKLSFAIAHCNFHLRGEDSNADMCFVEQMAIQYGVPFYYTEFDTFAEQNGSGESIEMVARRLRYDWFDKIGDKYDYVVTAHHADDNAETLLLNLIRGTGLKGLTGIPPINGHYLRPLLPFTSAQLMQYIQVHHLVYRIDKTNTDEQYRRNKIRHVVLPVLREMNPNIIETFKRNITHFQQYYRLYQSVVQQATSQCITKKKNDIWIDIAQLEQCSEVSLLLFEILHPLGFTSAVIDEVYAHLHDEPGKFFFSTSYILLKDRDFLKIKLRQQIHKDILSFGSAEEMQVAGFEVEKRILQTGEQVSFLSDKNIFYADADKLHFPLILRNWEAGDYFYPIGLKGKQKLSDFFTKQKVDRYTKERVPLLCCDGDIAWVVGMRADDRFKITAYTRSYYIIMYHE